MISEPIFDLYNSFFFFFLENKIKKLKQQQHKTLCFTLYILKNKKNKINWRELWKYINDTEIVDQYLVAI